MTEQQTKCIAMENALLAIAHMQIKEDTDTRETLALCMAIAQITLDVVRRDQ